MRLLLIEDEAPLARLIVQGLEHARYTIEWEASGNKGFEQASLGGYDLILLDLMLPGMDGWTICRRLRQNRDTTPILMLTALDEIDERVRGLETGADDYLPKPFAFEELKARVGALIRRTRMQRSRKIIIADLTIDTDERTVTRKDKPVLLTPREFDLLVLLAGREGHVVTRETVLDIWGDTESVSNVVDVHIASLRRKIDADRPEASRLIQTVHRRGYVLQDISDKSP